MQRQVKEVIIGGCPRTGTTALAALLSHDPKTLIMNECTNYTWGINKFPDRLERLFNSMDFLASISLKGITRDIFEEYADRPRELPLLLAEKFGFEVVGDKCPHYVQEKIMNNILSLERDIKFIMTIRDCRAVVASSIRNYIIGSTEPWVTGDIKEAIQMWVDFNESLLKYIEEGREILLIKYEDAVSDVYNTIETIGGFLDYKFSIDDPEGGYHAVHLYDWKNELPDIDRFIDGRARELMVLFGYY